MLAKSTAIGFLVVLLAAPTPGAGVSTFQIFGGLSEEDEREIGRRAADEIEREKRVIRNRSVSRYIQRLGSRLASNSTRADLPYHFKVIDERDANAFALPGGYIYLHRGIVLLSENESELAGVIAHEVAHVAARHSVEQLKKAQRIGLGLGFLDLFLGRKRNTAENLGALAANLVASGMFFKYSRDAEREADRLAVAILRSSEIDPHGMIRLFERMEKVSASRPALVGDFFASHPRLSERQENIRGFVRRDDAQLSRDSAEFRRIRAELQ